MTAGPMRRLFSSASRSQVSTRLPCATLTLRPFLSLNIYRRTITEVQLRQASVSRTWFTSGSACLGPQTGQGDHKPPDERTIQLGRTIRILHERLPTLLASPLPLDILSPHITLRLFPSTHPHLPTVTGKIPYTAALWTAPVAWGRVPVVGNVKLDIVSERMIKNGGSSSGTDRGHEKLIVRWKTCRKADKTQDRQDSEAMKKVASIVSKPDQPDEEFAGLFIFEFDEGGRILTHTIEHADENRNYDRTAKVISVTDWLLGRAWGRRDEEGTPSLAFTKGNRLRAAPHSERNDGQ